MGQRATLPSPGQNVPGTLHTAHSVSAVALQFAMVAMGVSGAAISTLVAIVVGVVWISFNFVDSKAYLRFHFGHWKPQFGVWREMLKIGLRVVQAVFLPVVALGFAVAPIAGQNFAARKGDRVRAAFKTAAGIAGGAMLVAAVGVYFGAEAVMRVFTKDADVTAVGVEYLHIVVLNFVASGITFVSSSMFQALGNTIPSLLTSGLRLVSA